MDSNGVTWTKEDIEIVEKFIKIKNSGYYCSGEEVTRVYNRILHKNLNVTNCGSCLRGRIQELETALNHFKSLSEKVKVEEVVDNTPEENNEPTEQKKRVGRPKKS